MCQWKIQFYNILQFFYYGHISNIMEHITVKQVPICSESKIALIRNIIKVGFIGHLTDVFRKYGNIVNVKIPSEKNYTVFHPEFAKIIFHDHARNYFSKGGTPHNIDKQWLGEGINQTSDYAIWKKSRGAAEPAFYLPRFKGYASQIVQNCLTMFKSLALAAANKTPIDINWFLAEVAIHNLTTTVFQEVTVDYKGFNKSAQALIDEMFQRFTAITQLSWILPTRSKARWYNALKVTEETIQRMIKERKDNKKTVDDVLNMLLKAYADEPDHAKAQKQVRDDVMTILFAGHETIGNALTWACLMISRHPDVERKLRHEIDTVLNHRLPTYEDVKSLRYTQAVLSETLRIYPISPLSLSRIAAEDDEMMGYAIPKGTNINVSMYHVHRHPDYWPNPEGFDPERFIKNPWYNHQQFAFIPGTAGERHCLGIHYALFEGALILATLLQQYRLTLLPGANLQPKFSVFMVPESGIKMMVEKLN
jgi:cytochrome P450